MKSYRSAYFECKLQSFPFVTVIRPPLNTFHKVGLNRHSSLRLYCLLLLFVSLSTPNLASIFVRAHKANMAQNSASFTIVNRTWDGKPDFIYPWEGKLSACVIASINVCRRMLRTPKIRFAFASLAREFNRSQPRAWYQDPRHGYETMEDVVGEFLDVILETFPIVYVDDSIVTPGCLGAHPRREWHIYFQPREQSILLNGSVREKSKCTSTACPSKAHI